MNLKFADNPLAPASEIAETISKSLGENKKVLLLLSGGSALAVAVEARRIIGEIPSGILQIGLIDERYGDVGHENSNWFQLEKNGFDFTNVLTIPVLTGEDLPNTVLKFEENLKSALNNSDVKVGIFGVGADGHTSGLLPHSPAIHSNLLVASYTGPDFERVTTTPKLIPLLNKIFVYVVGQNKWPVVKQMTEQGSIEDIPARILQSASDLTVYTDYKEE